MKSTLRDMLLLVCAGLVLVLMPILLSNLSPMPVQLSSIEETDVEQHEEKQQQDARAQAAKAKMRKIISCEQDEDCIIVDKDPCGCLVGPEGVTAINALHTLEFDQLQPRSGTKTCPETQPSTEAECSQTAQAVCQAKQCKIVY